MPSVCKCVYQMRPAQTCSRCNPQIPHYELRECSFCGHPLVEVLKDGGPIHEFDQYFRLNPVEAAALVAVAPLLREFPQIAVNEIRIHQADGAAWGLFKRKGTIHGKWCEWLEIFDASSVDHARAKVGHQKCEAICALEPQLRAWLQTNSR